MTKAILFTHHLQEHFKLIVKKSVDKLVAAHASEVCHQYLITAHIASQLLICHGMHCATCLLQASCSYAMACTVPYVCCKLAAHFESLAGDSRDTHHRLTISHLKSYSRFLLMTQVENNSEAVNAFMTDGRKVKIQKLVEGYVKVYSKPQAAADPAKP